MDNATTMTHTVRLKRLIAELGRATQVARQVGTGRRYWNQIIGAQGRCDAGDLLAQRLEQTSGLPDGRTDVTEAVPPWPRNGTPAEFVNIPHLEVTTSLGPGELAPEDDNIKGYLAFKNIWLQKRRLNPRFLTVIDAIGDSMHPTINDGDILLVDLRQKEPQDNRIFVLRLDNQLYAKRLHTRPGQEIVVQSDNPAAPSFPITLGRTLGVDIIGRVVWAGRDMSDSGP
ncbi:MAG: LexA family transcriptional regulator [Magnetococcales bacterium]|nr:LexA family transcriptional regulator [Magnetococcales bacterium]